MFDFNKKRTELLNEEMANQILESGVFEEIEPGVFNEKQNMKEVSKNRPSAHWIQINRTSRKCSRCQLTFKIAVYPTWRCENPKFCPNCGAYMTMTYTRKK